MFNWMLVTCPDCGCLHDDGGLIQTDNPEETRFVCLDCYETYYECDDAVLDRS